MANPYVIGGFLRFVPDWAGVIGRGLRVGGVLAAVVLVGCAGGPRKATDDRAAFAREDGNAGLRITAAERLWVDAAEREALRPQLTRMAWDRQLATGLRVRALALLLDDTGAAAQPANASLARLMLPTEEEPDVVRLLSTASAAGGWLEVSDGLVRRLNRPLFGFEETGGRLEDRPEAVALRRLHSGADLRDVVFGVFLSDSEPEGAPSTLRWSERARSDSWSLLADLDPRGEYRRAALSRPLPDGTAAEVVSTVADLKAAATELRSMPLADAELAWLASLREQGESHRRWWGETASVVSGLSGGKAGTLRLRHLEPVRWAAAEKPEWIAADRAALLAELDRRIGDRTRHTRRAEVGSVGSRLRSRERLDDWASEMSWADALALLVVDEAVRSEAVRGRLPGIARVDRRDTGTEYGGLIEADGASTGGFRLKLYPPRYRDRIGDNAFIASEDLIANSDHAVAHFHMQVQRVNNNRFAGPSPGDLEYTRLSGRTAVVFTSVGKNAMNVDVYWDGEKIVDLGEVRTDGAGG